MKTTLLILCLSVLSIAGCNTFQQAERRTENIKQAEAKAKSLLDEMRSAPTRTPDRVKYVDTIVSLKPISVRDTDPFSALRCRLNLATNETVTLLEVSQLITRECGIAMRVTPDALAARGSGASVPAQQSGAQHGQQQEPQPQLSSSSSTIANEKFDINYKGEVEGFLDMITSRLGLQWKKESSKKAVIYNMDTETFKVYAIASTTNMNSAVESGTSMMNGVSTGTAGGGEGSGGLSGTSGSSQKTIVAMNTDIWADIKTALENMKTPSGKFAVSPGTGVVIVTDTGEAMSRIRSYITKINKDLTKQITFNVQLISVSSNNSNKAAISWDLAYQTAAKKYGFNLLSGIAPIVGGNAGSFSVLQGSKWSGSQAILSALAEQGTVKVLRDPTASTLNLRPVSLQIAKQTSFIAGSTTTVTPDAGATTSIQLGQLTYGFNMSFYPYVMEDDQMLLQFSVNLSNLDDRRTERLGNATAELLDISLPINSVQQVKLRAGETMVITGFDQEDENVSQRGTDTPGNWLLGGSVNSGTSKTTLALLITPIITADRD